MLLSERVTQKVRRKERRAMISSDVGRVMNNENAVYVKETSRGRGGQKKMGALKSRKQKPSLARNNKLLFSFLLPPRKAAMITGSNGFKAGMWKDFRLHWPPFRKYTICKKKTNS